MSQPDSIVVVESYYEPMAAHLARTRLEAAGIPCFLSNENLVSLNRLYSHVAGGVRLHVRQADAEAAHAIIHQDDPLPEVPLTTDEELEALATSAVRCPVCQSTNVSYGPATRNTYSKWQMLLSLLLSYPLRGKRYHCFSCGHEFDRAADK